MSADKMPPLPATDWVLHMPARQYEREWTSGQDGYSDDDMHAYARAYAEEQTRELVEALELADLELARCHYHQDGPKRGHIRALIAKHKEQA